MTKEEITRMAREAGFERLGHTDNDWVCYPEDIERFATLVASAEREACANICFDAFPSFEGQVCVQLIRVRGRIMAKEQA